jgi:hypothetical protein
MNKPYKAKTLSGAERRVRELQGQVVALNELLDRWKQERVLLAKLAAADPMFLNPLEAMAAETLRDQLLGAK